MTATGVASTAHYAIHGVEVAVVASDPAVQAAIDQRLRDFRTAGPAGASAIRLEFACGDPGAPAPVPAGRPVYETPHGAISYVPEADLLWGEMQGVRLRCEPGRGVAHLRSEAFTGRALYLATHPLATIALMELLKRRGRYCLHAGCLADGDGRGVLIAGPSGAGKSTLALALTRAGLGFVSDDLVFLSGGGERGAGIRVLGFADAVGVTEQTAERFHEAAPLLREPAAEGFPKRLRRIEDLFAAPVHSGCEPLAIVFPHVARDRPSSLTPIDPGEALLRLVPDVLLTEPAATQRHLRTIGTLLAGVRCYELASGTDLDGAVALVRGLL